MLPARTRAANTARPIKSQLMQPKPHLTRTFKLSRGPAFSEKVRDIVGLYLNPPTKALVLSVDEKSQIQTIDSPQPACRSR
jgi:hypothetical protein